jgi:hypothetical protein
VEAQTNCLHKETFFHPPLIQTHLKKLFELFVRLKSLQSRLTNALFTQSERTVEQFSVSKMQNRFVVIIRSAAKL